MKPLKGSEVLLQAFNSLIPNAQFDGAHTVVYNNISEIQSIKFEVR